LLRYHFKKSAFIRIHDVDFLNMSSYEFAVYLARFLTQGGRAGAIGAGI